MATRKQNKLLIGYSPRFILSQVGTFTLADIQAQAPGASAGLLKKVLGEMKSADQLSLTGRGRGARWNVQQR